MALNYPAIRNAYHDFARDIARTMEISNAFIDGLNLANVIGRDEAFRLKAKETPTERQVVIANTVKPANVGTCLIRELSAGPTSVPTIQLLFLEMMPPKDPQHHETLIIFMRSPEYGNARAANYLFKRLQPIFHWGLPGKQENEGGSHGEEKFSAKQADDKMISQRPEKGEIQSSDSLQRNKVIRADQCQMIAQRILQALMPNVKFSDIHVNALISNKGRLLQDGDYSYIWDTPGSRIVIEGDPGTGKSTYLCNLALNWADNHLNLRKNFDFLFYITLGTLEVYSFDKLVKPVAEAQGTVLDEIETKSAGGRLLLILDGYDELDIERNKEIEEIIQMKKFPCVKTIISTRPSHTISIKKRDLTLVIKGFSEGSAKEFIQKLGLKHAEMEEMLQIRDNFPEYSRNPLILTSLAVLLISKDYAQLKDQLYTADGFALVVENLLKNLISHKLGTLIEGTDFNQLYEDSILQIGPLALERVIVDETQKRVIATYKVIEPTQNRTTPVHTELCEKSGLIFQRSLVGGSSNHAWEFIHEIVAEFTAAYYLAKVCEWDTKFLSEFAQSFFPQFIQTPLFYFLSKLSDPFQEAAIQEMSKYDHQCAPRFATIRTTAKCSPYHKARWFTTLNEWSIIECIKVMKHKVFGVSLTKCRIGRCLPVIFGLCKEVSLEDCEIGACYWNQEQTLVQHLFISGKCSFSDPSSFAQVMRYLDTCTTLDLCSDIQEPNEGSYLRLIEHFPRLREMNLWRFRFTDEGLEDWLETGSPLNTTDKIEFRMCDFSSLSPRSFARMNAKLHTNNIIRTCCTVPLSLGIGTWVSNAFSYFKN